MARFKLSGLYIFGIVLLIGMSFECLSCDSKSDSSDPTREEEMFKKVMAIHDEIMPRMSEIERNTRILNDFLNDWPEGVDSNLILKIPPFLEELNSASEEMWDWMNNFKSEDNWTDTIPYTKYLETELYNIKWVRGSMNTSIDNSNRIIHLIKQDD